ncbi:MAG TPA: S8 family serine peptidase [Gemmatales bacterium]|nr:S8 family serine peptidase [Gemmatales bacterium]HMP61399.1 S8 family serine peptidase [Gemmatales bacterium]
MKPGLAERLAELRRALVPEDLWLDPLIAGRGVRIAVIDTGVDLEPLARAAAERGLGSPRVTAVSLAAGQVEPATRPSAPHGTTVADVILAIAPAAELLSIDIFGRRGQAEVETLVQALEYASAVGACHLINLSLGIEEARLPAGARRQALLRALEACYHRGVHLVAAAHNDHPHTRSLPSALSAPLLSVDKTDLASPRLLRYLARAGIEFGAYSRGYFGPFCTEVSTSWAAPHLTGIAARLLSAQPDLKPFEVKTLLYWLSQAPGEPTTPPGPAAAAP